MGEEGGECPLSPVSIGLGSYKIVSTASWPSCCWAGHLWKQLEHDRVGPQKWRGSEGQGGPKKCLMSHFGPAFTTGRGFQKACEET